MYTRTRTLGDWSQAGITAYYYHYNGSTDAYALGSPYIGDYRVTSDVVNPDWRKRKSTGAVFNGPFSSSHQLATYTRGSRTLIFKVTPYTDGQIWKTTRNGNPGVGLLVTPPVIDTQALISRACTAALANVEQPTAEGMVMLAELRETLHTLRHPLENAAKAISRVRQKLARPRSPQRKVRLGATAKPDKTGNLVARDIASQHLAVVYGVMPFIHDCSQIVKAITQPKTAPRKTARGSATESASTSWTRTYNDGEVTGTVSGTASRVVVVRAYSYYEVWADLGGTRYGFTLSNVPSTLFELIPYSFLLDWVSNAGRYLSAITPRVGITTLSEGYVVTDTLTFTESLGTLTALNTGYSCTGGGDVYTKTLVTRSRVPSKLSDNTRLTLDVNLDVSKVASAISLITQRLKL